MRRIAFVTNLCPHYRRPLYELLATRFDVDFFFHSDGGEAWVSRNMKSERGDFRAVELRRVSLAGQPLLPGLARRLHRDRYDAVVKCLNGRLMVPFVYATCRARDLPLVLWTGMWHHPRTLTHRLTRHATEGVYRGADAVVAYGEHVKRFLEGVSGVSSSKIFVAGQAIASRRFSSVEPTPGEVPELVYVGQLEERKGLADLLAAVDRLAGVPLRLRLVGSGSLEEELRQRAARDPRLELAGYVPQERLPGEFARANCLVLPSVTTRRHREPWGLVVNEAMTAGIPVVVTDAVGAAAGGLVVDGRNGFVVPERDAETLARALQAIAADPDRAAALGRQARLDVARFTYETMAAAFEQAVEHAIEARRGGSR